MLSVNEAIYTAIAVVAASLSLRLALKVYYSDHERALAIARLRPRAAPVPYYKPLDTVLAPAPFLICWFEIVAAVCVFKAVPNPVTALLLIILAGGRFRALQEVGHNALHSAFCKQKWLQWLLSNVLFQFPMLKRDMDSRFITHVRLHHPNADVEGKDPNLDRIKAGGMVPGIGLAGFVQALLRPVTPTGFLEGLKVTAKATLFENSSVGITCLRLVSVVATIGLFSMLDGINGMIFGYVVPLLTTYPLFAWWSLLSKHRWHTPVDEELSRREHDFEHGRATDFTGPLGALQRYLIYPFSDAYHLAHHLYPFVRWEYLPAIDRELKIREPRYTAYVSNGMFFGRGGQPAALSELYQRLVRGDDVVDPGSRKANKANVGRRHEGAAQHA